jgi:hypothetical protein
MNQEFKTEEEKLKKEIRQQEKMTNELTDIKKEVGSRPSDERPDLLAHTQAIMEAAKKMELHKHGQRYCE